MIFSHFHILTKIKIKNILLPPENSGKKCHVTVFTVRLVQLHTSPALYAAYRHVKKKRSKSVFQEMQNNSFLSDDELAFLEFLPLKAL